MELTSKQKGNLTELQVITYLYGLGYQCSLPYGKKIVDNAIDSGLSAIKIEADDFFMKDGKYNWNPFRLEGA